MLDGFEGLVSRAKFEGQEFIETSPDIIKYFNRNGLNGAKYFIYKGIKVFPQGMANAILEDEATPMAIKMHGKGEGVINNGNQTNNG